MSELPSWADVKSWLYKWLPIFCGCHCKKERSFHYKGKQFPVCARCTGELFGMLAALLTCFFWQPPLVASILLMLPMVADGLVQQLTAYESNNIKRVVTGFLFGYGLIMFVVITLIATFRFGVRLGTNWK